MPRLARCKQCSRTGSLAARKRISRLPRAGYLANPASLIGIPRLELVHAGNKSASVRPPFSHWLKPLWKPTKPMNRTGSPQGDSPPPWSSRFSAGIWPTAANLSLLNTSSFLSHSVKQSSTACTPSPRQCAQMWAESRHCLCTVDSFDRSSSLSSSRHCFLSRLH